MPQLKRVAELKESAAYFLQAILGVAPKQKSNM